MTRYFAQNTPRAGLGAYDDERPWLPEARRRDDDPQPLLLQAGGCGFAGTACITAADPVKSAPVRISRSG